MSITPDKINVMDPKCFEIGKRYLALKGKVKSGLIYDKVRKEFDVSIADSTIRSYASQVQKKRSELKLQYEGKLARISITMEYKILDAAISMADRHNMSLDAIISDLLLNALLADNYDPTHGINSDELD